MTGDAHIRNLPPGGHRDWTRDGFTVTTDPARIDLTVLHAWFDESRQTTKMPLETIRLMVAGSLNFGLLNPAGETVGYARLVTDYATFAYLGDVFILARYRGKGLGGWFFQTIFDHPDCQGLRRWLLMCGADNVPLYEKFGFEKADGSKGGYALHRTDTQIYVRGEGKIGHGEDEQH
ncbi:MAG: GNAT family N-acetyltransferase [Alphaproteobacteria bacterium]|nr:GNAT family N-acetyltransferase [Alphaproteobacteria bacterium]